MLPIITLYPSEVKAPINDLHKRQVGDNDKPRIIVSHVFILLAHSDQESGCWEKSNVDLNRVKAIIKLEIELGLYACHSIFFSDVDLGRGAIAAPEEVSRADVTSSKYCVF